jgi:hypothetical protein
MVRPTVYCIHDCQRRSTAGVRRDNPYHRIFDLDVRLSRPERTSRRRASRDSILVIHLCLWMPLRSGILFCIPKIAATMNLYKS